MKVILIYRAKRLNKLLTCMRAALIIMNELSCSGGRDVINNY